MVLKKITQSNTFMCKWKIIAGSIAAILVMIFVTTTVYAGTIRRNFSWNFQGRRWSVEFRVPTETYRFFRDLPRIPDRIPGFPDYYKYSIYVTDPRDDAYLARLVRSLESLAREAGFDRWERLNFVVSFVQSLTYMYDNGHRARYPIETLVHRGGDCEDTSILAAALLRQMGYSVVLLYFPAFGEERMPHMAIGVHTDRPFPGRGWHWVVGGRRYFFVEIAGVVGWRIGEMPGDAPERATTIELTPIPWLELTWEATRVRWDHHAATYRVSVTVVNRGPGTSIGTEIYIVFVAAPWFVQNGEKSSPFTLRPFSERTFTFYLRRSWFDWTYLLVKVWSRNHTLITERSGRFRP